ncbi:MAG: altronate dehydratase [Deltaproteobacteria bacterium]|nr:MAG: altronate dehydratase [Deltaproteobacteria bacterium]
MHSFKGFERPDGSVGIRNHVAIIPSVSCVNGVVNMIAKMVPASTPLYHGHGCGRAREIELHTRTLANIGKNPNVAAALVVGLGCEVIKAETIATAIANSGKPVEFLQVQDNGGSIKTAEKAAGIVKKLIDHAKGIKQKDFTLDTLTMGLECGGSDAFSGITANPAVGLASDWLVKEGATVILTETTEMIGTTHILKNRASSPEVAGEVERIISEAEKLTHDILGPLASLVIAPGNMDGGMSSIKEKSLGCIIKGGSTPINQVVEYGEIPSDKGLIIMDGPGYDTESITGLAAAGSQLIIFTTGRGTPAGFPVVPVIKVASNPRTYRSMESDMDINAGAILEGTSLEKVGEDIKGKIINVLEGEKTKAELNMTDGVICMYTLTPAF